MGQAARPSTHRVLTGETLSTLSRTYNTTVEALAKANNLPTSTDGP